MQLDENWNKKIFVPFFSLESKMVKRKKKIDPT